MATEKTVKPAIRRVIQKRRHKRNQLWSDAGDVLFSPVTGGWAQMPRTVPLVASLIDELGGRAKAGRLYITLWGYELEGFVEVPDPALLALEAGYVTNRAERTFNERVAILRDLGFVRTARLGLREHGYVLMLDPHPVVNAIREKTPDRVPERWWTAFVSRCGAIGLPMPGEPPLEEEAPVPTPAPAAAEASETATPAANPPSPKPGARRWRVVVPAKKPAMPRVIALKKSMPPKRKKMAR